MIKKKKGEYINNFYNFPQGQGRVLYSAYLGARQFLYNKMFSKGEDIIAILEEAHETIQGFYIVNAVDKLSLLEEFETLKKSRDAAHEKV